MKYLYIIEKGRHNYSAYVPDLPGCVAAGKTKVEAERLIKEAIELHIEAMVEFGDKIPMPLTSYSGFAEIRPGMHRKSNKSQNHQRRRKAPA